MKKNSKKEFYKKFFNDPNIGLFWLNRKYKIAKVNPTIMELTGYKESELLGQSIDLLLTCDDREDSFRQLINNSDQKILNLTHQIKCRDGSYFWTQLNGQIDEEGSLWSLILIKNINKKENAIKELITSVYQKGGLPFMDAITLQLAKSLNANHVFIGEITDTKLSVQTLTHCMDGTLVDNFTYNLKDTPCERVYDGKVSVYPQDIQRLFPKDQDLKDLNIQGYAGVPLFNARNETIGLIVALYRESIQEPDFVSSILTLFANHVVHEYERQKSEAMIKEQAIYYQSILDGVHEPLMVIDKEYNIILMNEAAKKQTKNTCIHETLFTLNAMRSPITVLRLAVV